jgi:hypothetical protein
LAGPKLGNRRNIHAAGALGREMASAVAASMLPVLNAIRSAGANTLEAMSCALNQRGIRAVLDEVREWQNRPLDPVYPVVFFDALRVKIRDEGLVKNKAVYVALALNPDGEKDVLGLWIEQTEGAKFWLKVARRAVSTTSSLRWSTGSRASPRRLPRCSRRPWCRPASCT